MFGFGKKKLLRKMDGLSSVAQMAVYLLLNNKNAKTMGEDDATSFAAAVSNYLFGRDPDQNHVEKYTLENIESTGNQLIKDNANIRELVVQSLRVISIVSASVGKEAVGITILSTYGKEYPDTPDPGGYEKLVAESIQDMPPNVQQALAEMRQ